MTTTLLLLALVVTCLATCALLLWQALRRVRTQSPWPPPPVTAAQSRWATTRARDVDPDATQVLPTNCIAARCLPHCPYGTEEANTP